MPQLHAQPYDLDANGFYFESMEDYTNKAKQNRNGFGDVVEEYEIQFIDGEDIDCALAKAWGINQANIGGYFKACDEWEDYEKKIFIIAVGEIGHGFDPEDMGNWLYLQSLNANRSATVPRRAWLQPGNEAATWVALASSPLKWRAVMNGGWSERTQLWSILPRKLGCRRKPFGEPSRL